MNNVFSLLFLASFICLIVGLVKPTAFSRFIKGEITRKKIGLIFGISTFVFFVLSGVTANANRAKALTLVNQAESYINENKINEALGAIDKSKQLNPSKEENKAFSLEEKIKKSQSVDFLKKTLIEMSNADFELLKNGKLKSVFIENERLNKVFLTKLQENADERLVYIVELEKKKKLEQEETERKETEEAKKKVSEEAKIKAKEETAVAVSSVEKISFVYDVPSLIDKNYDQVKAILGKTTKVVQADNEADALFIKQGFQFYVTYNPKTKEVKEFFLVTDDPSGKTKDIDRLMDIGNLTKDDARYAVEFTRPLDDKSAYTGIEVRAATAAKAKADRAKAVKEASTTYNRIVATACANLEVTAMLKAPSTAKFPRGSADNILFSPEENSYTVISYVDAQNSFGAMIRTNYICVVAADNMDKCHNVRCQLE